MTRGACICGRLETWHTQRGLLQGDQDVGVRLAAGVDNDLDGVADHVRPGPYRRAGGQGADVAAGVAAEDDGDQLIVGPQRRVHGASDGLASAWAR